MKLDIMAGWVCYHRCQETQGFADRGKGGGESQGGDFCGIT